MKVTSVGNGMVNQLPVGREYTKIMKIIRIVR